MHFIYLKLPNQVLEHRVGALFFYRPSQLVEQHVVSLLVFS